MTQSRRVSLIEAITNVTLGYGLAVIAQIVVFPWFGLDVSIGENLAIGAVFVGISLLRSYALRRLFEGWRWNLRSGRIKFVNGTAAVLLFGYDRQAQLFLQAT